MTVIHDFQRSFDFGSDSFLKNDFYRPVQRQSRWYKQTHTHICRRTHVKRWKNESLKSFSKTTGCVTEGVEGWKERKSTNERERQSSGVTEWQCRSLAKPLSLALKERSPTHTAVCHLIKSKTVWKISTKQSKCLMKRKKKCLKWASDTSILSGSQKVHVLPLRLKRSKWVTRGGQCCSADCGCPHQNAGWRFDIPGGCVRLAS